MSSKVTSKGAANKSTKVGSKTKQVKSIGQSSSAELGLKDRKVERDPGVETEFNVFLVHSKLSLDEIHEILSELDAGEIGSMRVEYDREGNETNRTVVLAERSVYDAAIEAGLGRRMYGRDFAISRYALRPHNAPREGFLYKFFVPLPKEGELSGKEARNQVEAKLRELVAFGVLEANSYRVVAPLKSRETGAVGGAIFVTFTKEVDRHAIQLVKIVLDDTYWVDEEGESAAIRRVLWAKDIEAAKAKAKATGVKASEKSKAKVEDAKDKELPAVNGPVVRTFTEGKVTETVFVDKAVKKSSK